MQSSVFVTNIDVNLACNLRADLAEKGFLLSIPPHTIFQAKKSGIVVTLYRTGKLTVAGKDKHEFITYYLEPKVLKDFSYSYPNADIDMSPRIGVDEAGKGDFFGPLCIAALYADHKGIETLLEIGVKDSKVFADRKILMMAKKIRTAIPSHKIIRIYPQKYNELYEKFNNLNTMLAWGHATAIESLHKETSCPDVIIDQFAAENVVADALKNKNLNLNLTQRHKAEEDVIVAGASILAREAFLLGLDSLGKKYQFNLPKGASNEVVKTGRALISIEGQGVLKDVAKLHFKTAEMILKY